MEREIDLTPARLVAWLRADRAAGDVSRVRVQATREFLAEDAPAAAEGLDAEDGIAVVTTVGQLEVTPSAGPARWVLRLRIEDGLGEHLPDDGSVPDGPEEIGLEVFAACFLAAAGPDATVTLEAPTLADFRGFEPVLARILSERSG